MKLVNWGNFNLPFVFQKLAKFSQPPKQASMETRPVADALNYPQTPYYNPDSINFPQHDWATPNSCGLPGNGGYITQGLNMVAYDHQATWDRSKTCEAGPVREFIGRVLNDNRIKHI